MTVKTCTGCGVLFDSIYATAKFEEVKDKKRLATIECVGWFCPVCTEVVE